MEPWTFFHMETFILAYFADISALTIAKTIVIIFLTKVQHICSSFDFHGAVLEGV